MRPVALGAEVEEPAGQAEEEQAAAEAILEERIEVMLQRELAV